MSKSSVMKRTACIVSLAALLGAGCSSTSPNGSSMKNVQDSGPAGWWQYQAGDMRLGLDRYKDSADSGYWNQTPDGLRRQTVADGVQDWRDYTYQAAPEYGGTAMSPGGNVTEGGSNVPRMEAAQDCAERLTGTLPIETANVLVTDNRAYVAAKVKEGQSMADDAALKAQIADTVRSVRPQIQDVHVSTVPEFAERTRELVNQLASGQPAEQLMNEWRNVAAQMFPHNAAR